RVVEAHGILFVMIRSGEVPDADSYNILMNGYCLAERVDDPLKLFDSMVSKRIKEQEITLVFSLPSTSPKERQNTGEDDVAFKVLFCGICHSDLHSIKNEWGMSWYPMLLGHEIVGIVMEVGNKVTKFKVGDKVGVGCLVGACHSCDNCNKSLENYCPKMIFTYGGLYYDETMTYGGYSDSMVANEHYVVRIPDNLPLDASAPLLKGFVMHQTLTCLIYFTYSNHLRNKVREI
ncbi:hypothetical protein IFM89_035247, partial [Coptis chinensis]